MKENFSSKKSIIFLSIAPNKLIGILYKSQFLNNMKYNLTMALVPYSSSSLMFVVSNCTFQEICSDGTLLAICIGCLRLSDAS
jgi:hypothetical protein